MAKSKKAMKCGTINPNTLKVAGKPNRAMTPEVKLAPVWIDRKNDYRRHNEKQKIRRYSDDDYGNGGFFALTTAKAICCSLTFPLPVPLPTGPCESIAIAL